MGLVLSLSTVNCGYIFNGNDDKYSEVTPPCVGEQCKTDLEAAPEKISYTHGGWHSEYPNWRLKMVMERQGNKVIVLAETPQCSLLGEIKASDYVALNALTQDIETQIQTGDIIDAGEESITITEDKQASKLYLRMSDGALNKPIVKNTADAEKIRAQIQVIADQVLKSCAAPTTTKAVWYRQNVDAGGRVDSASLVPHPSFTINIHDIRVTHEQTGTRIQGFRTIVEMDKTCQVQVNTVVAADAAWRTAVDKISIQHTDVICMPALGAKAEDMYVMFPRFPESLTLYKRSGDVVTGAFGCMTSNQVRDAADFQRLLKSYLDAQTKVCISNISRPY